LCDSGDKYRSKLYNRAWIEEHGMGHVLQKNMSKSVDFVQ